MDEVTEKDYDEIEVVPAPESKDITEEEFQKLLDQMQNPIEMQKEIGARLKNYLDKRMSDEILENGLLSKMTLEWVSQFNKICDSIQKGLYGTKNINLNIHRISHSDISAKIREAEEGVIIEEEDDSRKRNKKTKKRD